ncbi:uncharacterized protein TRAVEDRAFT_39960 [Trametes versicolor FP-101664 SS1]|uniref:uncharacterized protein n=1 Tax=Trametes versicolor (strain FP-101664) TaxID=717944 RepID=UPI000462157D|nr:uncharacterized protein TRAVEDRAFT_39960 [Trametes versicolor FP-101664 SS1]EIW53188.1 hypothetical protein TRAVEDRAFT_39960 [Trametes versicolor FP-101664 SS1]
MDPELAAAMAAFPARSAKKPASIAEARDQMDKLFTAQFVAWTKTLLPPASTYAVQDRVVPVEDGKVTVRCTVPVNEDENMIFPLLFNIHGGSWVSNDISMEDYYLRRICVDLQISVVNVNYRLAPEYPFPTSGNDCLAALRWTAENAQLLKADLSKGFLLLGDSAGANLCAVLTHEIRGDPVFDGRQLTGQFLREPFVVHPEAYPEKYLLFSLLSLYQAPPSDPRFSPLLYPSHEGLPRAYIQAMGLDTVRDDAFVYQKALQEAGVETKLELYPGVTHGFHNQFPTISMATKVWDDTRKGLQWLLRRM